MQAGALSKSDELTRLLSCTLLVSVSLFESAGLAEVSLFFSLLVSSYRRKLIYGTSMLLLTDTLMSNCDLALEVLFALYSMSGQRRDGFVLTFVLS